MRRACEGITTTGRGNGLAVRHNIECRGAGLKYSDGTRNLLGQFNARDPQAWEDYRLETLRALKISAAETQARHAAKPPKIKKGKKNRKPKKK
jgi:hypothetical protein